MLQAVGSGGYPPASLIAIYKAAARRYQIRWVRLLQDELLIGGRPSGGDAADLASKNAGIGDKPPFAGVLSPARLFGKVVVRG